MDGLIVRWMVMLLRYGGAGGENEAAPGHTSSDTLRQVRKVPVTDSCTATNNSNCSITSSAPAKRE